MVNRHMNAEKRAAFVAAMHEILDEVEHIDTAVRHGSGLYGEVAAVCTYQDGVLQDVNITVTDRRKPLKPTAAPSLVIRRAG